MVEARADCCAEPVPAPGPAVGEKKRLLGARLEVARGCFVERRSCVPDVCDGFAAPAPRYPVLADDNCSNDMFESLYMLLYPVLPPKPNIDLVSGA